MHQYTSFLPLRVCPEGFKRTEDDYSCQGIYLCGHLHQYTWFIPLQVSRGIQTNSGWIFIPGYVSVRTPAQHSWFLPLLVSGGVQTHRRWIFMSVCICENTCINIHGSYVCSCPKGFKLTEGGYSCQRMYLR